MLLHDNPLNADTIGEAFALFEDRDKDLSLEIKPAKTLLTQSQRSSSPSSVPCGVIGGHRNAEKK